MIIKKLSLENFRNIYNEELNFDQGVNILTGMNAQGKTNIIEALWLFSSCKSFRTNNEKEFINHEKNISKIEIDFIKNERIQNIQLTYHQQHRRELYFNGIKAKPSDIVGNFTTVLFFPSHLNLIKEGPEGRRKFLDFALCQIKPQYFLLLSEYNKVLFQRNSILKDENADLAETLEIWDIKLAKIGARIHVLRKKYIRALDKYAKEVIEEISGGKETLSLIYESFIFGAENLTQIEESLLTQITASRVKDIKVGYTNVGIHKDDILILLNERQAKAFASQGQQRSAVMAMKLAEAEILNTIWGEYPILLFDDVFSELDKNRKKYIVEKIKNKQVIVTACESLDDFNTAKIFEIEGGKVFEE